MYVLWLMAVVVVQESVTLRTDGPIVRPHSFQSGNRDFPCSTSIHMKEWHQARAGGALLASIWCSQLCHGLLFYSLHSPDIHAF